MYFYCYVYVFLLYVYVSSSCQLALFGYPDWGLSVLFPQLLGKCQGITRKDGTRPALFPNFYVVLYIYCLFCVVLCIVCVYKCVLYYCHRVETQLQLTNIPQRQHGLVWYWTGATAVSGRHLRAWHTERPILSPGTRNLLIITEGHNNRMITTGTDHIW